MKANIGGVTVLLLSVGACPAALAESCVYDYGAGPVVEYTRAMKEYRFKDAYGVLTDKMTDGMAREEWAAGQSRLFDVGQVVIGKLDVRWPQHIDPASCAKQVLVPNVLSAKDRFNNQGSVEFELYTVVNDGGTWKIDSQETLFDEADVHRWFPGHEIPEYKDQLPADEVLPGDEGF
jgi:hypothetical protein